MRDAKITERVLNELAATSINKQYFIEAPKPKRCSGEVKMKVEDACSKLGGTSGVAQKWNSGTLQWKLPLFVGGEHVVNNNQEERVRQFEGVKSLSSFIPRI